MYHINNIFTVTDILRRFWFSVPGEILAVSISSPILLSIRVIVSYCFEKSLIFDGKAKLGGAATIKCFNDFFCFTCVLLLLLSKFIFIIFILSSVYLTKLLTHQIKNVGDCIGEIGVYHENKLAISYPMEVKLQVNPSFSDTALRYKLPELPKKVLYYFTESGTYGEKKELEILPSSKDRKPIRTLPSPLKVNVRPWKIRWFRKFK